MEKNNDIKQSLYDIQPGDKVYLGAIIFYNIYCRPCDPNFDYM